VILKGAWKGEGVLKRYRRFVFLLCSTETPTSSITIPKRKQGMVHSWERRLSNAAKTPKKSTNEIPNAKKPTDFSKSPFETKGHEIRKNTKGGGKGKH